MKDVLLMYVEMSAIHLKNLLKHQSYYVENTKHKYSLKHCLISSHKIPKFETKMSKAPTLESAKRTDLCTFFYFVFIVPIQLRRIPLLHNKK